MDRYKMTIGVIEGRYQDIIPEKHENGNWVLFSDLAQPPTPEPKEPEKCQSCDVRHECNDGLGNVDYPWED